MKDFITTWDAEERIIWSLKIFIISAIQFITFYMNPELTSVTLGCPNYIFDVSIIDVTGESCIRICRNMYLVSLLIGICLYKNNCCKLLWELLWEFVQFSTFLFEGLLWIFIFCNLGWIRMKACSPTNFPSP